MGPSHMVNPQRPSPQKVQQPILYSDYDKFNNARCLVLNYHMKTKTIRIFLLVNLARCDFIYSQLLDQLCNNIKGC